MSVATAVTHTLQRSLIYEVCVSKYEQSAPSSRESHIDSVAFLEESNLVELVTSDARQDNDVIFFSLVVVNSRGVNFIKGVLVMVCLDEPFDLQQLTSVQ